MRSDPHESWVVRTVLILRSDNGGVGGVCGSGFWSVTHDAMTPAWLSLCFPLHLLLLFSCRLLREGVRRALPTTGATLIWKAHFLLSSDTRLGSRSLLFWPPVRWAPVWGLNPSASSPQVSHYWGSVVPSDSLCATGKPGLFPAKEICSYLHQSRQINFFKRTL